MAYTYKFVSVAGSGTNSGDDIDNEYTFAQWLAAYDAAHVASSSGLWTWFRADSTYSFSADVDIAHSVNDMTKNFVMEGYTTSTGDGGQVTFSFASGYRFTTTASTDAGGRIKMHNIIMSGNTTTNAIFTSGSTSNRFCNGRIIQNNTSSTAGPCVFGSGSLSTSSGGLYLIDSYLEQNGTGTTEATSAVAATSGQIRNCVINCPGGAHGVGTVMPFFSTHYIKNIFIGDGTTAGQTAIYMSSLTTIIGIMHLNISGNIFVGWQDGIYMGDIHRTDNFRPTFINNLAWDITGYGMNQGGGTISEGVLDVINFAVDSAATARTNMPDLIEINPITLTTSPFVNAASGDYSLTEAAKAIIRTIPGTGWETLNNTSKGLVGATGPDPTVIPNGFPLSRILG